MVEKTKESHETIQESACGFLIEKENYHLEVFARNFAEFEKCLNLMKENSLLKGDA